MDPEVRHAVSLGGPALLFRRHQRGEPSVAPNSAYSVLRMRTWLVIFLKPFAKLMHPLSSGDAHFQERRCQRRRRAHLQVWRGPAVEPAPAARHTHEPEPSPSGWPDDAEEPAGAGAVAARPGPALAPAERGERCRHARDHGTAPKQTRRRRRRRRRPIRAATGAGAAREAGARGEDGDAQDAPAAVLSPQGGVQVSVPSLQPTTAA